MRVLSTLFAFLVLFSTAFAQVGQPIVFERPPEGKIASLCDLNLETKESIESCILEVFKGNLTAVAVAKAESQLNPNAVNYNGSWSKDCGVFQLNSYYHKGSCELTTKGNILYAYALYQKKGWQPWVAWQNGSYLKYLK